MAVLASFKSEYSNKISGNEIKLLMSWPFRFYTISHNFAFSSDHLQNPNRGSFVTEFDSVKGIDIKRAFVRFLCVCVRFELWVNIEILWVRDREFENVKTSKRLCESIKEWLCEEFSTFSQFFEISVFRRVLWVCDCESIVVSLTLYKFRAREVFEILENVKT